MIGRYRWIAEHLRPVMRPAIAFEVWSTLVLAGLLGPASGWVLDRLVSSSGHYAISDHDLLSFALSWQGALFLLLGAGFTLAFWFAEIAGLLVVITHAVRGERVAVSRVLAGQLARLPALVRLGVLQGAVYVVLALPFVGGIWLTYRLILNEWDFYYYLNVRPPSWWVAVAIAGVLAATYAAIALWIYVRWLVAVPALVFENATALGALRESWRRTRGRFLEFAAPRAVGWIIVLLLAAATTWLIRFGGIQAVAASGDSLRVAVVLLIATLALLTVTDVIWLIIAKTVQVMLTVSCYVEGAKGEPGSSVAVTSSSENGIRWASRITVVVVCVMGLVGSIGFLQRIDVEGAVEITGHRGSKVRAPENTLSALEDAIREGADFAEIDVQTTADGVVVLLHDADLMRVASQRRRLGELNHDELADIDVGSWFAPEFADERIPTLQQAIDLARESGLRLNIELKFARPDPTLTAKVVELVTANDFTTSCVVSSLNVDAVTEAKRRDPDLETGLIILQSIGAPERMDVDFLSMSASATTSRLVRDVHRNGRQIHVWTVNDRANVLSMIGMGVDNIITDHPAAVRGWIEEWNDLGPLERLALVLADRIGLVERAETEGL